MVATILENRVILKLPEKLRETQPKSGISFILSNLHCFGEHFCLRRAERVGVILR